MHCTTGQREIDTNKNKPLQLSRFQSFLLNWEPVELRRLEKKFKHTQPLSSRGQESLGRKWPYRDHCIQLHRLRMAQIQGWHWQRMMLLGFQMDQCSSPGPPNLLHQDWVPFEFPPSALPFCPQLASSLRIRRPINQRTIQMLSLGEKGGWNIIYVSSCLCCTLCVLEPIIFWSFKLPAHRDAQNDLSGPNQIPAWQGWWRDGKACIVWQSLVPPVWGASTESTFLFSFICYNSKHKVTMTHFLHMRPLWLRGSMVAQVPPLLVMRQWLTLALRTGPKAPVRQPCSQGYWA